MPQERTSKFPVLRNPVSKIPTKRAIQSGNGSFRRARSQLAMHGQYSDAAFITSEKQPAFGHVKLPDSPPGSQFRVAGAFGQLGQTSLASLLFDVHACRIGCVYHHAKSSILTCHHDLIVLPEIFQQATHQRTQPALNCESSAIAVDSALDLP